MTKTRTQQRGECCYCGKEHALTASGTMVAHGYTIEWNQQFGNCSGVGRVHLGHEDAPKELKLIIDSLKVRLADLPEQIKALQATYDKNNKAGQSEYTHNELRKLKRRLNGLNSMQKQLPEMIEVKETFLANWKPKAPRLVDLDVEEAEQRKARQAEAEQKKAEKAKKQAEKEAKAAERQAKSDAKWKVILSENLHQVEEKGTVLLEWVAAYTTRHSMERDHYERFAQWCKDNGITDNQERINMAWAVTMRVRENAGKNKQLHKW